MDEPQRAILLLKDILARARLGPRLDGLRVLEIGPGDALSSALVAYALGARQTLLIDSGRYASTDMRIYAALANVLRDAGLACPDVNVSDSFAGMLEAVRAQYLTDGLASLNQIAESSVDFAFSNAVLEHIRLRDFLPMMKALRRAMDPGGRVYHKVDLRDHLAEGLNNLRFPDRFWEADWVARSGFYTNRLGMGDMILNFRSAGFDVEMLETRHFSELPLPIRQLAPRFRVRSKDDLLISGFSVLLTPLTTGSE